MTTPCSAPSPSTPRPSFLRTALGVSLPFARARLLFALGRVDAAFALTTRIKALKIPTRNLDLLRAQCRLKQNSPGEAFEFAKEELRLFPNNAAAERLLTDLRTRFTPTTTYQDAHYRAWVQVIRPYTMVSDDRLWQLFSWAKRICEEDRPGNFAECGVAGGGSSALIAKTIATYSKRPRRLYAFDTFEGMPAPRAEDTHQGVAAADTGWGEGTCAAPMQSLRNICRELAVTDIVVPVQGFFADTLPATRAEMGELAFLHLDGDWYESTRDILVNLYDQVAPGGYMQIDDYGYWEGCRRAIHDFERERGLTFELHNIDGVGHWMTRPQS
ncbi:macrocin O-methyltransferase [Verrucomicrobia bacterium LW23]|nr:macrocin O-methyltransferase [Verrucomicrobia bacterium LW23]